jgi:hypothetical protein
VYDIIVPDVGMMIGYASLCIIAHARGYWHDNIAADVGMLIGCLSLCNIAHARGYRRDIFLWP